MKVDGKSGPIDVQRTRIETGHAGKPQAGAPSDHVDVSSSASTLREARAAQVTDDARVERLRDAIAKGTFVVDHDAIAARMLEEERG
jgi:flagellar biosynthesis anti-sigma factor FlgM